MASAWKNFCFILSVRSDFHMVMNLSIAVHTIPMWILALLSVDEILLLMYIKLSYNFKGLEMAPSWLGRISVASLGAGSKGHWSLCQLEENSFCILIKIVSSPLKISIQNSRLLSGFKLEFLASVEKMQLL